MMMSERASDDVSDELAPPRGMSSPQSMKEPRRLRNSRRSSKRPRNSFTESKHRHKKSRGAKTAATAVFAYLLWSLLRKLGLL